jgi:hypothetical protein
LRTHTHQRICVWRVHLAGQSTGAKYHLVFLIVNNLPLHLKHKSGNIFLLAFGPLVRTTIAIKDQR